MNDQHLEKCDALADKIRQYEAIIKPLAGEKLIDIQWAFMWDCSAFGDHRYDNYFRLLREYIYDASDYEVLHSYLEYLKTVLAVLLVNENPDNSFRGWFQEAMWDQFADHSRHHAYQGTVRFDLAQQQWDEFMEVWNGSHRR